MNPRTIKSFVIRQRTTHAQERAIAELSAQYVLPWSDIVKVESAPKPNIEQPSFNIESIYGNANPLVVEIGFGMGDATWQIAQRNPDVNYLAIDVHEAGVGALLLKIKEHDIKNIRIINADAVEILTKMIPLQSLLGFHIFCPDPWPKRRHFKRRLLQSEFIAKLRQYLRSDGYIHIITDHENYKDFIEKASKKGSGINSRAISSLNAIGGAAFEDNPRSGKEKKDTTNT